jgi:competence protein ComFB
MEIHNVMEELVFDGVERVSADIDMEPDKHGICTCPQCRMDAACFVLNRLEPHYIVSSRGIRREKHFDTNNLQKIADITALIYKAFKQVNKHRRPGFEHTGNDTPEKKTADAYFNIPVIIGRIFNGKTFEPMRDIDVRLLLDGKPAVMKDANWQNPCTLIKETEGTFAFWPVSLPADSADEQKWFNFSITASSPEFPLLTHHFELPVVSEKYLVTTVAMYRTHKTADLYMFDLEEDKTAEIADGRYSLIDDQEF